MVPIHLYVRTVARRAHSELLLFLSFVYQKKSFVAYLHTKHTHTPNQHTIVHETGHWLGVYHVFDVQLGCADNDFVADTPSQKVPSVACDIGKDTCPNSPGTFSI
jgi:Pregnancy-associated plasma protein-A